MTATTSAGRAGIAVAAWGALTVALLSPWPFAAVEPFWWALTAALVLGFVVTGRGIVCLAERGAATSLPPRALALAVLLPCVALATAVPLPAGLVDLVSPGNASTLGPVVVGGLESWRSLSLFAPASVDALLLACACAALAWCLADAAARRPGTMSDAPGAAAARLLGAFVLGGVLIAAFGLVQRIADPHPQRMFFSVEIWEVGTPFGPYVNRNHFGGAMLLFLGGALGVAGRARALGHRRTLVISAGAAILLAVALLATTSRGAVLGAVVLLGALLLATPGRSRLRMAVACAGFALVALAGLAATGILGDLSERLFTVYGRWRNRFLVQGDALRVFTHFPVVGTGAGTFPWVFHVFQDVEDARHFSDAHSDWVQFLMETGLLGAAYTLGLMGTLAARVRAVLPMDSADRWLVLGPAAGLAGITAHGFVETNLHIPANALLAAAAVGLTYGASVAVRRS